MGKEDLLRFSETPFWQRFRLISILLFWLAWLALLGAVIGLTIAAPRCGDQPTPIWWQQSVIYQIYVRSFFDTDGDGIGDIKGITAKLPYLKELKVDAILLSSVFKSEHDAFSDYGYEILNHTDIDNTYGDLTDFQNLIEAAHNESIRVLIDFVPNHTGKRHMWFNESQHATNNKNPFRNYYVWAESSSTETPNNWISVYNESAWEYDSTRQQWYLHQFLNSQPELNLRSTGVQRQLEEILRFWLNHGIDGFRVVNSAYLFEDPDLLDEQESSSCNGIGVNRYDCLNHERTRSLPENFDLVARWREIIDEYSDSKFPRVLLTDADVEVKKAARFYGNQYGLNGANLAINYGLTQLEKSTLSKVVDDWMQAKPADATSNWLTGDQDRPRLNSYISDSHFIHAVHLVRMTLPGAAFIYYGEEIGMQNVENLDTSHDPAGNISLSFSRDSFRTPMQWTNETSGFSNASKLWLPLGNLSINVESQKDDPDSTHRFVKSLIQLRLDQGSLRYGAIHYLYNESNAYAFVREHEGNDRILVIVYMGSETSVKIDLKKAKHSISVPGEAEVVMVTDNSMKWKPGDKIKLREVQLNPGQGVVASWEYKRPLT